MKNQSKSRSLFVDTSIHVGWVTREAKFRKRISEGLSLFSKKYSGLVVLTELKRRLLRDGMYLLNQLNEKESFHEVQMHLNNVLPTQWSRKRTVCINLLHRAWNDPGTSLTDAELTERAQRFLHLFLKFGVGKLETRVDKLIEDAGCACSAHSVVCRTPYVKYEIKPFDCSKVAGKCGIISFLSDNRTKLLAFQRALGLMRKADKSQELLRAEEFLNKYLNEGVNPTELNPCTKVGDLLIALESSSSDVMYTMNLAESKFFCHQLNQEMRIRPNNPAHDDREYKPNGKTWPK